MEHRRNVHKNIMQIHQADKKSNKNNKILTHIQC